VKARYIGVIGLILAGLLANSCLDVREPAPATNACTGCHGSSEREGTALQQAAPPTDLSGGTETSSAGVGAHQRYLYDTALHVAFPCDTCHRVPTAIESAGHTDDAYPADLTFGALATTGGASPSYDRATHQCTNTYCHLDADAMSGTDYRPTWNAPQQDPCGSCHTLPPAPPHPQNDVCAQCHGAVVDAQRDFIDVSLHVNGTVDVALTCHSCHGSEENNAPPVDTQGNTETTARGVGAHQTHLAGGHDPANPIARAVLCEECHVVPQAPGDAGHYDSDLPAELTFSGVAVSYDAAPAFDGTKCANTYCHGDHFVKGNDSGGSNTQPTWTKVDGTEAACGSCHSLPPPPPHPLIGNTPCSDHHSNVNPDLTFKDPSLHINGKVDF